MYTQVPKLGVDVIFLPQVIKYIATLFDEIRVVNNDNLTKKD